MSPPGAKVMQTCDPQSDRALASDLFTIPYKDGHILFLPRLGVVAGIDERAAGIVDMLVRDGSAGSAEVVEWRDLLTALGALGARAPEASEEIPPFRPTHVTLSLTSRCHLRCVYCYARAGEQIADMDPEIRDAAIALVAANAANAQEHKFTVGFHGEGEPTANWTLFRGAVERANATSERLGLDVEFTMSTNGMWSHAQRTFIAENFRNLSISLDGWNDVQDRQRPTARGGPSFLHILSNLKFLETAGVQYGIRATVLPESVEAMLGFLDAVANNLDCDYVHFEPVFATGRGCTLSIEERAFHESFVSQYRKAVERGAAAGIQVAYSGCRPTQYGSTFCGVAGPNPNFFVTTGGLVSSCFEIVDPETAKGHFTVYGCYDRQRRGFVFDQDRLRRIRTFGVHTIAHCRGCFAQSSCAGDCFARADFQVADNGDILGSAMSPRCVVNRATTLDGLVRHGIIDDARHRLDLPNGAASTAGGNQHV
jgi:uncharacterized protein